MSDDYEVEAIQFQGMSGDRPWHADARNLH